MSNEIKTHRFIVTVPEVAEEEAPEMAALIEELLFVDGFTVHPGSVEIALGASTPEGVHVFAEDGFVNWTDLNFDSTASYTAFEARQLAGRLLELADELE